MYDSNEEEEEVKFHHNWRDVFDMRSTMSMHVPMRIIRNGIRRCKDDILKEQQTRARSKTLSRFNTSYSTKTIPTFIRISSKDSELGCNTRA